VFALCALGLAYPPLLVAAALAGFGAFGFVRFSGQAAPVDRRWLALFCTVAIPFALLYVVNAAAPEISPDGSRYHLGLVRRYLSHHGFYRITTDMYASLTQGCEMLFLAAYAVGRHSVAALVHCSFLLALPVALIAYGRRFGMATAGVIAALIVFVSPIAGVDGASAYVDVALAFAGFIMFYFLEIWDEQQTLRPLLFAGLMAGFCFAIKYTGIVAGMYAVGYVLLMPSRAEARGKLKLAPHLLVLVAPALLLAAPWLLKNWIEVSNPFSPFFNRIFPNPYIHIAFEEEFGRAMRHFNGASLGWSTPLDVTVRGGLLQGTLGPALLLAPAAAAALRERRGGRVLTAAALFALPWFTNIGTRFLIPALPFIALAMGMTLAHWPKAAAAIVVINAVLCWPDVLVRYCDPYSWYISRFPIKAALRVTPEQEFMDRWAPEVRYARLIQDRVPATGIVYTAQPIMEAYTDRTVLLNYAAALNSRIEETLNSVVKPAFQPSARTVFQFESTDIRGFRLIAAGDSKDWAIHEIVEPAPNRVTASLNAWDQARAGDGRLATAWRAWQPVHRGDFVHCELAHPARRDSISVVTRSAEASAALRLVLFRADGQQITVDGAPQSSRYSPSLDQLRAEAIADVRESGVTHLAIHDDEPLGPDFRAHGDAWQVRFLGEAPPLRLYEILHAKTFDTQRESPKQ
jgi:hypothetical protein